MDGWFAPAPDDAVGVLVGAIRDTAVGDGVAARVAGATGGLDQRVTLANPYLPYGVTANLAVRAQRVSAVGGFEEERRIAEDADLCWRIQRAGWALEERPDAGVDHRSRETLVELWRQRHRRTARPPAGWPATTRARCRSGTCSRSRATPSPSCGAATPPSRRRW